MFRKNYLKTVLPILLAIPTLYACNNGSNPIIKPVDYNATFIESDKVVTNTQVKLYPGPSTMTSSSQVGVKVNGHNTFVYETLVNNSRQFSWTTPTEKAPVVLFDFEGRVTLEITANITGTIVNAYVSPLAYKIPVSINGNKMTFTLDYQSNYVLTYEVKNGDEIQEKVVHIFSNEIEDEPNLEDPNLVYVGPGIYKADSIPVKDGCTIYLAGGAYVYGDIHAEMVNNVSLKGHGIISGDIYTRDGANDYDVPVVLRNASNITIEDVTFLNPAGWVLNLYKCNDVTINNVKIITARQNGDGISLQGCKNVTVNGGFVRTWDDSLVVKNNDLGTTENITFDGVSVWTDLAQSMEVGYETHGAYMKDITFKNITVLHNYHKAAISMHNCDEAAISNVKYENITIEDAEMFGDNQTDGENDFLIDFTIAYNTEWTVSGGDRGTVDGVNIHNVKVYKEGLCNDEKTISSRILGESNSSKIKNVTIKGVEIEGKSIQNANDLKLTTNQYVENIKVEYEEVHGAEIKLPYKLELTEESTTNVIEVPMVEQEGISVPEFAWQKGDRSFLGNPSDTSDFTITSSHSKGTTNKAPADDGSGSFDASGHQASYVIDNNPETYWKSANWKNENDEFAALTIDFNKALKVGTIRLIGEENNSYYSEYTISVWVKKNATASYTRLVGLKEYEMSPIANNCIDINISAADFYGIQLRFFRKNTSISAKMYALSEIEFYSPSLAFSKAIVDSTPHNDVYTVTRVVDGDPTGTSYYESKTCPAFFVVDLGDVYNLKVFGLFLIPSLAWGARTQEIEILTSDSNVAYSKDNTIFKTAVEKTAYVFDPATGNNNIIKLDTPVSARYVKVVIYSNSDKGGYGAQLSEFTCYAE